MKIKALTHDTVKKIAGAGWPKSDNTLDLADHPISFDDLSTLLDAINKNPIINHLNLSGTAINTEEHITLLASLLVKNKNIHSLDLSNNEIDSTHATLLLTTLKKNKSINHINLQHNLIGDNTTENATHDYIDPLFSISSVDISHNGIQSTTAVAMAKKLEKIKSLHALIINHNLICAEGIKSFSQALSEKNKTLSALHAAEQYNPAQPYKTINYQSEQKLIDRKTKINAGLQKKTNETKNIASKKSNKIMSSDSKSQTVIDDNKLAKKVKKLFNYVFSNKPEATSHHG